MEFNARQVKNDCVEWIRQWFAENGDGCNAIIGISGGKDSSVVAALCVEALGKDRVLGVLMPNGVQSDIDDSYALVNHLGIKFIVDDIKATFDSVISCLKDAPIVRPDVNGAFETLEISNQTVVNLPARLRMVNLFAIAQSYNGRVANTSNLSERYIGYSTFLGDGVGHFSPLANLVTDEVIGVGMECDLPKRLVRKIPADGLSGKKDEDNFGFTYQQLNQCIRTGHCDDPAVEELINRKHIQNLFKLLPMPSFNPKNSVMGDNAGCN